LDHENTLGCMTFVMDFDKCKMNVIDTKNSVCYTLNVLAIIIRIVLMDLNKNIIGSPRIN